MSAPWPLCKVTVRVIAAAGFFVYFDSMVLAAAEQGGDCEEDYVQFGRDILFITSHRSAKVTTRLAKLQKYTLINGKLDKFRFPFFFVHFYLF